MSESKKSVLLESNPNLLENNLKFVKNELEEEFEQIFGAGAVPAAKPADCKIVKPTPGMCIKCFKVNTGEKFFINLCQTDGIPPPEDISEDELTRILQSDTPSSYRIPMSISEPRSTTDKSGNLADACDIAVNPKFFKKCEQCLLFRDFLVAIILEALSDKYNIQLKSDNWIILKNRKVIGTLVTHRVQNRDVKTVYDSYKNPSDVEKKIAQGLSGQSKSLIQELDNNEALSLKNKLQSSHRFNANIKSEQIKQEISEASSTVPEFRILGKMHDDKIQELLAELYLPNCLSADEITVDIAEDRILIQSIKRGYIFDKFVDYKINQEQVTAKFDTLTKMLKITIPVVD